MAAAFWLVFMIGPAASIVTRNDGTAARAVGLTGILVFCLGYAFGPPLILPLPNRIGLRLAYCVAMFALATALFPLTGQAGLGMYVYVVVVAVFLLPTPLAVAAALGLLVLAPLLVTVIPGWTESPLDAMLPIATASAAVFGVVTVIRRNLALAQAREELAELAVAGERARLARDMHDLLGHSLTVITVKSELAKRLVTRDPPRAEQEVSDIERLAREALADVRATLSGYAGVTLARELSSARTALEAAGIRAELPNTVEDVPGERRELFGWVVREGVTNVVRHSGATICSVHVDPTGVEVLDDGRGCTGETGAGQGLGGLHERLAAAGGRLEAGSRPGGGFRLAAQVDA